MYFARGSESDDIKPEEVRNILSRLIIPGLIPTLGL